MTNRKISLTRLHAINWYGYQDCIPVTGNLLLAGLTGSGKSILMDLIQLVLVGDRRMTRFNQSATGERSGRDLKGYCLGDIKQEEGGVAQYMRKSAVTFTALEFTWPDHDKIETWGLRIEFTSAAENKGRIEPFMVPDRLEMDDLCPRDLHGQRVPLDHTGFKNLLREKAGQSYPEGIERYRRDMASPGHLNFDPDVLGRLLPSAMSFTFLRSFDEFCRNFILPAESLDISDVTASYRAYRGYEKELAALADQQEILTAVRDHHRAMESTALDAGLSRYLHAELESEAARTDAMGLEAELDTLRAASRAAEKELGDLTEAAARLEAQRTALERAMNASGEGQLYSRIRDENKILSAKIESLRQRGRSLGEALALRLRNAARWRDLLEAVPLKWEPKALDAFNKALATAASAGSNDAATTLPKLQEAARSLLAELQAAARPALDELRDIRHKLGRERDDLANLQGGRLPFATQLLDALNTSLLQTGPNPPAAHLRALCEVRPECEDWRPAIEVAFTRKLAIVVERSQFAEALRIFHSLKPTASASGPRESLIDPDRAAALDRKPLPGSLAEKIETFHPVAAAMVHHLFGDLQCLDSAAELATSAAPNAILRDGFLRRGPFLDRTRHYDNMPLVGERGLRQQIEWKKQSLTVLGQREHRLLPLREAVDAITERSQSEFEVTPDIHRDLAETAQLPELEARFATNRRELAGIDREKFESVEAELSDTEHQLATTRNRRDELLANNTHREIVHREARLDEARETVAAKQSAFDKIRFATDHSPQVERLATLRTSKLFAFPQPAVAAREFEKDAIRLEGASEKAWAECHAARILLAQRHPRFEELPVEPRDNTPHTRLLEKIENAEIPAYRDKAATERGNWERFFRENILSRLHAKLREIERTIDLLNSLLQPHPIGDNRYRITARKNPDFDAQHRLLDVAHGGSGDDLFTDSLEASLQDTLNHFLTLLTEQADSREAARLLDYRCYFEYDMEVRDLRDPEARPSSVDRHSGKFSGGENQSPYFIAILASYLRAYKRHDVRGRSPSLALVPIDEAFSKLSGERIRDCIQALKAFGLQGVFSMSTGNIPYAFDLCDHLLAITKDERKIGNRLKVRNIAAGIARDSPEARAFLDVTAD